MDWRLLLGKRHYSLYVDFRFCIFNVECQDGEDFWEIDNRTICNNIDMCNQNKSNWITFRI